MTSSETSRLRFESHKKSEVVQPLINKYIYIYISTTKASSQNINNNNNNNLLHLYSTFLGTQSALHRRGDVQHPPGGEKTK